MKKSKINTIIGNSLALLSLTSQMTMAMDMNAFLFNSRTKALGVLTTTAPTINTTLIQHVSEGVGSSNESVKKIALETSVGILENKSILETASTQGNIIPLINLCKKTQQEVITSSYMLDSIKDEMQIKMVETISNIEKAGSLSSESKAHTSEILSSALENSKNKEAVGQQAVAFLNSNSNFG